MSDFLRFRCSEEGFNLVLNGLRYFIDKHSDDEEAKEDCRDLEHAFRDIYTYSILKSEDFNHETGEIYRISVSCTQRSMSIVWLFSDWFGLASMDEGYRVNYAADLVDKHWEYVRQREENRMRLNSSICDGWDAWLLRDDVNHSKKAFAEEYGYPYSRVLEVLRERERSEKENGKDCKEVCDE